MFATLARSKSIDTQLKDHHEQVKMQVDSFREHAKAQAEAAKQASQAASQQVVDQSKLQLETAIAQLEQSRESQKTAQEAFLKRMEIIMNHALEIRAQNLQHEQKMAQVEASKKPRPGAST